MTVLAIISPVALVVWVQLGFGGCTAVNLLGLPWPAVSKVVVSLACGVVIVASTALIVRGFGHPVYKTTAIAMTIYSAAVALPTLFVILFSLYGDVRPNCIAG